MSEQIDWSKAPADATHHITENNSTFECWLKPGYAVRVSRGSSDWVRNDYADKLIADCATARPTTPSWSGEVLPPVGVVCEMERDTGRVLWHKVRILYIGSEHAIVVGEQGEQHFLLRGLKIRPIRTTEQIAADEREEAIAALVEEMKAKRYALEDTDVSPSEIARHYAQAIYDAGLYRKP